MPRLALFDPDSHVFQPVAGKAPRCQNLSSTTVPSGEEIRSRSSSTMKRFRVGLTPGLSETAKGRRLSSSVPASSRSATVRASWDSGARYVAGSRACRSTNSSGQLP